MKSLIAFIKKEFIAHIRGGKIIVFASVFALIGVLNPALAKLTPWLLDLMSETLAEAGMNIVVMEATALDSWLQFYENLSIAFIVFVIVESSIFTREYRSGTLVLSLTKGLERYKVIIAKTTVLTALWTGCYLLCFGITYGINEYLWDNSIAEHLMLSIICWWVFGMMFISMIVLFSAIAKSSGLVIMGSGSILVISTLISIVPRADKYLPTMLSSGSSLIYGLTEPKDYIPSLIITSVITIACFIASIPIFNKKQL